MPRRYALLNEAGRPVAIAEAADMGDAVLWGHHNGYARVVPEDEVPRASAPAAECLAERLRRLGLPEEAEGSAADGWPRTEAKRPAASSAAVASTAGLPVVKVPRQEIRKVAPGRTTEVRETTSQRSGGTRATELREPADAQAKLRGALERLGVRESAADQDVVDLVEGS